MLYRPDPNAGTTKLFIDANSRSRLPYRTAKEMRVLYPYGDFLIVGEIGNFARPPTGGDLLLTDDGKTLPVHPRGSLEKPFEWIAGYIPVNHNAFLVAVGSVLPSFLRGLKSNWARPSP